ncbi:hypothetical protein EOM86_04980 [Candidatus Nomurabacteria bacterium]|nr:hypothetical protein [Candidatus Nomurabacteria bacterium]
MKTNIRVSRTRQVCRYEPVTIEVELSDIEIGDKTTLDAVISNKIAYLTEKIDEEIQKYLDIAHAAMLENEESLNEDEVFEEGQG